MKKLYPISNLFLFLISLLLLTPSLSVFAANGKITGRVTDSQTGEPLPLANVVITHSVIGDGKEVPVSRVIGAATDMDGYFFIMDVPSGVYNINASLIGYNTTTQKMVQVSMDRTITVNFELVPTSIQTDQVVITAKKEIIKQDVSSTQEVISTARIEQMPVTRVDEFVGKVKGIELVSTAEGNGLSVRGGSVRETDVRLDGMSMQDPRSGNSYLSFNSTTVQELQVLTGGFEAKYGGIQSGLLNAVTKDGQRDRFTATIKADYTYGGQKRFFGTNLWSEDSWIYRMYAGEYAYKGALKDTTVPEEFRDWGGWYIWRRRNASVLNYMGAVTDTMMRNVWLQQHPTYKFADKPDIFLEGSITGPMLGSFIPVFREFADRTTFLLGFKYENAQLAFPIGPRNNYIDWNTQLKLTTALASNMRLSVNGMYAKINSIGTGANASYSGGSLVDQTSSFGFLNSTDASVGAQARLLNNRAQIFNKSRIQFYDQKFFVGGGKLTHTVSSKAFYTLDMSVGYTDQTLTPFTMDTSNAANYIYLKDKKGVVHRYLSPEYGTPNGSTNYTFDLTGIDALTGGQQRVDSSYSYAYQFKGDMTVQVGRHHQVEAGFSLRYQDMLVYSGTWFQSQLSYTPDTWQYYKANPLEIGLYLQDKIEFEGMILNAGFRLDYFNPLMKGFKTEMPLDEDFIKMYSEVYDNLPGTGYSYERWQIYRDLLADPLGLDRTENRVQVYLSPRLGVSFPITDKSKMYFNFGHFYQRPATTFLYKTSFVSGGATLATPGLDMEKTISYEFGYEQILPFDFLINIAAYYKDVKNSPLSRTYHDYDDMIKATMYFPDRFKDVRGVEFRFERPFGRFMSLNAMYDYMISTAGQSGLGNVYENVLLASSEARSTSVNRAQPLPRANVNLNLHTPSDFGPEFLGLNWLGSIYTNFFFEWRAGQDVLLNAGEPDVKKQIWAESVNRWNIDLRASKAFNTKYGSLEFVVTVKNLTNNKWLEINNMRQDQRDEYFKSLRLPHEKPATDDGLSYNDKVGQYKSDDNHIKTGWYDTPLFLNPRRIVLGLRLNI